MKPLWGPLVCMWSFGVLLFSCSCCVTEPPQDCRAQNWETRLLSGRVAFPALCGKTMALAHVSARATPGTASYSSSGSLESHGLGPAFLTKLYLESPGEWTSSSFLWGGVLGMGRIVTPRSATVGVSFPFAGAEYHRRSDQGSHSTVCRPSGRRSVGKSLMEGCRSAQDCQEAAGRS